MNRDIEVFEGNHLKAHVSFRYEATNSGVCTIKVYKTEPSNPPDLDIHVPLLLYTLPFTHAQYTTLDEVRNFDKALVNKELTEHAPGYNEKTWLINYDHEDIRSRFCVYTQEGTLFGIAGVVENFADNTSYLQLISAIHMHHDQRFEGDRFVWPPQLLIEKSDLKLIIKPVAA